METSALIANRIIELCKERKIKVGKLCTMAGVTTSTVHDILSGKTKNAGILTIKKLCDALNITLAYFFDTPEFNNSQQEII